MYQKGDIVYYYHINPIHKMKRADGIKRIAVRGKQGAHCWVILHSYTHPLKTYLIAPITSRTAFPETEVEIKQSTYSNILTNDSYIDLRYITVVNEELLQKVKGLDKNGDRVVTLANTPRLQPLDIVNVDLAAMQALELGNTVRLLVDQKNKEYSAEFKAELKKQWQQIYELINIEINKIENIETRNLIQQIIDRFGKVIN